MTFKEELHKLHVCKEAIEWVGDRTLEQAWNECERGDWMLWLAQTTGVDLRILTLAKARCAKLVIHLMKDERSRKAVEIAERFGLGEATREELDEARSYAAAYAAAAAHAAYAADAAYVAYTAYAAEAAGAAADTADAYAAAAYTAYATEAARKETLQECADICRETLTGEILVKEDP